VLSKLGAFDKCSFLRYLYLMYCLELPQNQGGIVTGAEVIIIETIWEHARAEYEDVKRDLERRLSPESKPSGVVTFEESVQWFGLFEIEGVPAIAGSFDGMQKCVVNFSEGVGDDLQLQNDCWELVTNCRQAGASYVYVLINKPEELMIVLDNIEYCPEELLELLTRINTHYVVSTKRRGAVTDRNRYGAITSMRENPNRTLRYTTDGKRIVAVMSW